MNHNKAGHSRLSQSFIASCKSNYLMRIDFLVMFLNV